MLGFNVWKNHPCPLLEGRRGTQRVLLRDKKPNHAISTFPKGAGKGTIHFPGSRADGYGSPPYFKEGPGVVLPFIKQ
jgi:hypothetical protein